MANATYINHEPVRVLHGTTMAGLVDLGYCGEGAINVTIPTEWVNHVTHQTGGAAVNAFYKGGTPTVECTFEEINNWDLWETVFVTAEKQRDAATPPMTRIGSHTQLDSALGRWVGQQATTFAKFLVLRPLQLYVAAGTETDRDWVFTKAFCSNIDAIPFGVDDPNAFPTTWTCLLDPTTVFGDNQWIRGRKTATSGAWVAA